MTDIPDRFVCGSQSHLGLPPLSNDLYGRLRCRVDGVEHDGVWAVDVPGGWIGIYETDPDGNIIVRGDEPATRIIYGQVELSWIEQ